MAFIPAANCVRVVVDTFADGVVASNIYHVFDNDPGNAAHHADIITVFNSWMATEYMADISSDWGFTTVTVTDAGVPDGLQTISILDTPIAGGLAATSLPANCALVVTLLTAHIGKSRRGRKYIAGIPEANADVKLFSSTILPIWEAHFNALHSALITLSDALVVASFFHDNAPRTTALLTDVEEFRANQKVNSQRRRTG